VWRKALSLRRWGMGVLWSRTEGAALFSRVVPDGSLCAGAFVRLS
jgi:hypothetical protein